jgi:hypothetical protein
MLNDKDKHFLSRIKEAADSHYPFLVSKEEGDKLDELIERGYLNPVTLIQKRCRIIVKA